MLVSSARMAASRSARAVDCPAMGVPPDIEILVEDADGLGVELLDVGLDFDFGLDRASAIRKPADDACCLGACFGAGSTAIGGVGACFGFAAGVADLLALLLDDGVALWGCDVYP